MRPHSIKLNAFGPYNNIESINFDNLSEIFLISGPTGSGKTTIFDGMMFALYGTLPGTRESKQIVSNNRDIENEPFVEFIFSLSKDRYKIKRIPSHLRQSKKGKEKIVEEPQSVIFYKEKNNTWEAVPGNLKDINQIIEEKLFLKSDEFSKIILLPQGEFERFLIASSDEKRNLLRTIFPIIEHEKISETFKKLNNKNRSDLSAKESELDNICREFNNDDYDENINLLKNSLKKEKLIIIRNNKKIDTLTVKQTRAEELENNFKEFENYNNKHNHLIADEKIIKEKEILLEKAISANQIVPDIKNLKDKKFEEEDLKEQINLINSDLAKLKTNYTIIKEEHKEIPAIEKELKNSINQTGKLEQLLPKEDELNKSKNRISKSEQHYNIVKKKNENYQKEIKNIKGDIIDLKERIEEQLESGKIYEDLLSKKYNLNELYNRNQIFENHNKEKNIYDDKLKSEKIKLKENLKTLKYNSEEEKNLKKKKERSLAANLSQNLTDNEPCPVCGSKDHPFPASVTTELFTEDDKLAAIEKNILNTAKAISAIEKNIENIESHIEKLSNEILKNKVANTIPLDNISKEMEEVNSKLEIIGIIKKDKIQSEKKLKLKENSLNNILEQSKDNDEKLSFKKIELATLKNRHIDLEKELKGLDNIGEQLLILKDNIDKKNKKISDINQRKNSLEKKIEIAKQKIKSLQEQINKNNDSISLILKNINIFIETSEFNSIKEIEEKIMETSDIKIFDSEIKQFYLIKKEIEANIDSIKKRINNKSRPDMEIIIQEKEDAIELNKTVEKNKNEIELKISLLKNSKNRYDKTVKELEKLQNESKLVQSISNDLNGKNSSNINFPTFILSAYLKEVALYASKRFNSISDGRYTLIVNDEITHGGRQAGLDLDVFDAYSGKSRSVKTLSGGEKFLASISLALGLADVIQSRAGGIELNSIFIDEGFGSLDNLSLDRAITILDEIRGDRMVGIISHVDELKNRIPSQIKIIKNQNGSSIIQ